MADASQPSWHTSTLSQLTGLCVIAFLVGATLVAAGVIFLHLPLDQAKQALEPVSWLTGLFVTAYLTARKTGNGGGNESVPKPRQPV